MTFRESNLAELLSIVRPYVREEFSVASLLQFAKKTILKSFMKDFGDAQETTVNKQRKCRTCTLSFIPSWWGETECPACHQKFDGKCRLCGRFLPDSDEGPCLCSQNVR